MFLKLMYITNDIEIAQIADKNGVDWIFIDLEINGKEKRQGHLDTVISHHSISDVKLVKEVLNNSKLLVRINPIYSNSQDEINKVIEFGADIVMLPFFKSKNEVQDFIGFIDGRVKTCLLVETPESVENIDDILSINGIDYIHIGLNDLHLGYKKKFMFELLSDGTVGMLCKKFETRGIPYGFGGVAKIGQGILPAELILSEHYRLHSSMAILSRAFCDTNKIIDLTTIDSIFGTEVKRIRDYEMFLAKQSNNFYIDNKEKVGKTVQKIVNSL